MLYRCLKILSHFIHQLYKIAVYFFYLKLQNVLATYKKKCTICSINLWLYLTWPENVQFIFYDTIFQSQLYFICPLLMHSSNSNGSMISILWQSMKRTSEAAVSSVFFNPILRLHVFPYWYQCIMLGHEIMSHWNSELDLTKGKTINLSEKNGAMHCQVLLSGGWIGVLKKKIKKYIIKSPKENPNTCGTLQSKMVP